MVYNAASRLYTGDYDTGDFTQWEIVQNVAHNDPGEDYDGTHYALTLSTATVRQGTYAARFEVRDGDIPFSTTERSEVQGELYTTGGEEGDDRWYQFSVLFDDQFPDDHASIDFGLVNQWHDESAGSPPIGMYVDGPTGEWGLRVNAQSSPGVFISNDMVWSTALDNGTWHDIVLHIVWSTSDTTGLVELWHNGTRQIFTDGPGVGTDQTVLRTLVPTGGGTYYKEGYYRGPAMVETGVVYHDGYAVADNASGLDLLHERHNACPEPAPIDPTGWTSNRTLTVETVSGFDRPEAAQITGTGSGGEHYILTEPGAATAGTDHTVSVSYRTGASTQVTAYILYYDSGGSVIGFSAHPDNPISTTANTVARLSVTGTTAVGTVTVGAQISLVSASTSTLQATMASLEEGSLPGAYFDGDTTGASWDGATGRSASTLGAAEVDDDETDPDTALAAAIDDPDRVTLHRILVDWDRDGGYSHDLSDISSWVTGLSITQDNAADLPVDASLVEGTIAATLTATLGGLDPDTGLELTGKDGLSALDVFGPYREDSPLWRMPLAGCGVKAWLGLATDAGGQLVQQITGQVRAITPDSRSREVQLDVIDLSDTLRARITLPALGMEAADAILYGDRWAIAPQAIVDYVLRRNGIYASPPAHPDAQISCTGHGWLGAEAGRNALPRIADGATLTPGETAWVEDPDHPYGMLAVAGDWDTAHSTYSEFFAKDREGYRPQPGYGIGMAAWMRVGNDMGLPASSHRAVFQLIPLVDHDTWKFELLIYDDGGLGGVIDVAGVDSGFVQPISTSTAWMYVGLHFRHNHDGTTTIRYRQNGATSSGNITTPAVTSTVAPFLQCTAWHFRPWSNFQVWFDYDPPSGNWPGEVHTSQASLDAGLNRLTHLPDVVNAESLQVIKDVVGAEYGLFGFDPTGEPYFRTRVSAADPNTVDKTVTADASILDLASGVNVDTVRNVVTAETTRAYLRWPTVVVESRDAREWESPPGIWEHWVPLPYGAVAYTTITLPRIASASWDATISWGYVSVRADSPSTEITSGILVAFSAAATRQAVIKVWNYSPYTVRFATTSGSPALRALGWGLVAEAAELAEVRAEGSITTYGERLLALDASPWRQLTEPLQPVMGGLLATLSDPLPVIPTMPIVGDPRLESGDVLRIRDEQGQGSFRSYVVGTRQQLDKGQLTTEVTPRPIVSPGFGLIGDDELGIIGDTLVIAP